MKVIRPLGAALILAIALLPTPARAGPMVDSESYTLDIATTQTLNTHGNVVAPSILHVAGLEAITTSEVVGAGTWSANTAQVVKQLNRLIVEPQQLTDDMVFSSSIASTDGPWTARIGQNDAQATGSYPMTSPFQATRALGDNYSTDGAMSGRLRGSTLATTTQTSTSYFRDSPIIRYHALR